jgi:N-formylglutamate deformylase
VSSADADLYTLRRGASPLVISVPHSGTALPPELAARLTPLALQLPDTDWYVDRLYEFASGLDATMLVARYSRYVIDLNRPPDDAALYAGAPRTGLCPALSFAGEPLYRAGADFEVPATELQQRRTRYWQPYHDRLRELIANARARHGYALLLDAHSIPSVVPRLFSGRLPDINVGCNDARSCDAATVALFRARLAAQEQRSWVIDGRFKGGHITRHYGQPAQQVHAVQIELAQCGYMDETGPQDPEKPRLDRARMAPLQDLLRGLLRDWLASRRAPAVSG